MDERTLIIFKPDAVERKICWKLLKRWEQKNYKIIAASLRTGTREEFSEHYIEHKDRDFYDNLVEHMIRGPSFILVIEGPNVISWSRKLIGSTNPDDANIGTIRGDYGTNKQNNLVHASDSLDSAIHEIGVWFPSLDSIKFICKSF